MSTTMHVEKAAADLVRYAREQIGIIAEGNEAGYESTAEFFPAQFEHDTERLEEFRQVLFSCHVLEEALGIRAIPWTYPRLIAEIERQLLPEIGPR